MRIEINIADEGPEAKILGTISDPSAFLLDLLRRSGLTAQSFKAPDYVGSLAKIRQSPNRFKTREEIDAYIGELRSEW